MAVVFGTALVPREAPKVPVSAMNARCQSTKLNTWRMKIFEHKKEPMLTSFSQILQSSSARQLVWQLSPLNITPRSPRTGLCSPSLTSMASSSSRKAVLCNKSLGWFVAKNLAQSLNKSITLSKLVMTRKARMKIL